MAFNKLLGCLTLTVIGAIDVAGQVSSNIVTILPTSNRSSVGELRLRDKQSTSHYIGFKSPDTITTNNIWTLPSMDSPGVLVSDGSNNLSLTMVPTLTEVDINYLTNIKVTLQNGGASTGGIIQTFNAAGSSIVNQLDQNGLTTTGGLGTSANRIPKLWVTDIDCSGTCLSGSGFVTLNTIQTINATKTITQNWLFKGADIQFATAGGGGASWTIRNGVANVLSWYDSGALLRMSLDNTGTAGLGTILNTPTIRAQATNTVTIGLGVLAAPSSTVDTFEVLDSTGGTKHLWVDSAGVTHMTSCVGCSSVPSDMMTTDTFQTVTGSKTIQNNWFFQGAGIQFGTAGGGASWTEQVDSSNSLRWFDSGGSARMNLDSSGVGGAGVQLTTPSVITGATNTITVPMTVYAYPSSSVDTFRVWDGTTKYLWVDNGGVTRALRTYVDNTSVGGSAGTFVTNSSAGTAVYIENSYSSSTGKALGVNGAIQFYLFGGGGNASLCVTSTGVLYRGSPGC